MNRSLAAIAAGAMLLASAPTLGFADEASSASSSSTSSAISSASSSTSSASSAVSSSISEDSAYSKTWQAPCNDLKGLLKAQCIVKHNPAKKIRKDRVQRMNDDKILNRTAKCEDKEGSEKVDCLRKHGLKSLVRKVMKEEMRHTIRGKVRDDSSSESSESSED